MTFAHIQHTLPEGRCGTPKGQQHLRSGHLDQRRKDRSGASSVASSSLDRADSEAEGVDLQDLEIVVGQGKRSHGSSVLRDTVEAILNSKNLRFRQHANKGRLVVPREALRTYVEAQKNVEYESRFFHMASMQYVVVALGLSAVLSAVYVVPLILKHML